MNNSTPAAPPGVIAALLRKLVAQYVPTPRQDSALAVTSRLLESALAVSPSLQTADSLTQTLIFRLARDGRQDDAAALRALIATLKFDRAVPHHALWPILYVLNDLRASPPDHPTPPTLATAPVGPLFIPPSPPPPTYTPHASPLPSSPLPLASPLPPISPAPPALTRHTRSQERALVDDLILIVQGEDARYLRFSSSAPDAQLDLAPLPGAPLTQPIRDSVLSIAELGFLFRVVRARARVPTVYTEPTGDGDDQVDDGAVAHSVGRAVARELDAYYRSVATLRDGTNSPTLFQLFVWAQGERRRLRWLARLCDETRGLRGGQMLGALRTRRGSYVAHDIRAMMSRVVASAAAPINRMLVRWLSEGVVPDSHNEFFVMEDPKVAASASVNPYSAQAMEELEGGAGVIGGPNAASAVSHRIWWGLFKIRKDRFPGCMDAPLAQKALITGKSVAFLRRCCTDSVWVEENHAPLIISMTGSDVKLFEADLKYDRDAVRDVIERARESASKRLKELFFEKFDLSHHFGAIKQYLLLSQGDFSQALMDGLAPILDGDGKILRNNLTGFVDAALQSCSSFNEETDQDILERLDVQIEARADEAAVGWDVFTLTYRVEDAPLNTVFSVKVMDAYLLIFRLLWRLKRMDHLMSEGYSRLREAEALRRRRRRKVKRDALLDGVLKRVHFVRMKITHLVHNMQHYCTVEVLEGCWAVLERELSEAEDLDGMIQAHARYLTLIKDRTLLSDRSRYVASELNGLLDIVPRFSAVMRDVCERWEGAGVEEEEDEVEWNSEEVLKLLRKIEKDFDERFQRLLQVLTRHCQMVDTCVFLLFRLDFNGYYAQLATEAAAGWSGLAGGG